MADQYRCRHGHQYYDGDQGVGSPYDDGWHDAQARHERMDVTSLQPWERNSYEQGYADGGTPEWREAD
jgi:hypothetical protein